VPNRDICLNDPINFVDPTGEFAWLPALLLGAIIIDAILNTDIEADPCGDGFTVSIPPPSMWDKGVPLPFFAGVEMHATTVDAPVIGPVGVPTELNLTVDPVFAPAIPYNTGQSPMI
jgi:hypothetical protein